MKTVSATEQSERTLTSNLNADLIVFSSKVMQIKQEQLERISRTDEVIGIN